MSMKNFNWEFLPMPEGFALRAATGVGVTPGGIVGLVRSIKAQCGATKFEARSRLPHQSGGIS